MNKYDVEYNRIMRKMERGGSIDSYSFEMNTPSGVPTKLSYIQQLLVRTTSFKEWFGDWEKAGKLYVESGRHAKVQDALIGVREMLKPQLPPTSDDYKLDTDNIVSDAPFLSFDVDDELYYVYKNVSKIIDIDTLEPRVVYHGTASEDEFFKFKTEVRQFGRPYAYFAFNKEYSQNFSKGNGYLYECFLNVKEPYHNVSFTIHETYEKQLKEITFSFRVKAEKLGLPFTYDDAKLTDLKRYNTYAADMLEYATTPTQKRPFWYMLSTDSQGLLKKSFQMNGYDGVMFGEEIRLLTDKQEFFITRLFTRAVVVFEPNQVKLADGRNVDFFGVSDDIRYADGGSLEKEIMLPDTTTKYAHLKGVLKMQGYDIYPTIKENQMEKFEVGGTIKHEKGTTTDGKKGGYFEGRSHAEGGIKAFNVSTNTPIEVEGGEVIITKKAVDDDDLKEFEGEMLTNREILSRINQSGGGVAFEEGGEIHSCNCSGNKFAYGGETIEDYEIIRRLQSSYENKENMKNRKVQYGHNLMRKMKQGGFI